MKMRKTMAVLAVLMASVLTACNLNSASDDSRIQNSVSESAASSASKEDSDSDEDTESESETDSETESESEADEEPAPDELTDNLCDCRVLAGDTLISIPCSLRELEEKGWVSQEDYSGFSLAHDSQKRVRFEKDGFLIEFDIYNKTENDVDSFAENQEKLTVQGLNYDVRCNTQPIELPNGIKTIESTESDVIAAYGEPDVTGNIIMGETATELGGTYYIYSDDTDTAIRRVTLSVVNNPDGDPTVQGVFVNYSANTSTYVNSDTEE